MSSKNSGAAQGVGISWVIALVLTAVFVTLRLVGVIAWSWWWVFAPLWILFGIDILILAIVLIVAVIISKL